MGRGAQGSETIDGARQTALTNGRPWHPNPSKIAELARRTSGDEFFVEFGDCLDNRFFRAGEVVAGEWGESETSIQMSWLGLPASRLDLTIAEIGALEGICLLKSATLSRRRL